MFLGKPIDYWVELQATVEAMAIPDTIENNIKLLRVARAAKEVIGWMDESGPGVDELMAALADLPEGALKKQQRGCHTVECGARILAGMDCICGFKVR